MGKESLVMMIGLVAITGLNIALNMYNYLEECIVEDGSKWAAILSTAASVGMLVLGTFLLFNKFYVNNKKYTILIGVVAVLSAIPHLIFNTSIMDSSRGKTFGIVTNSVTIALILIMSGVSIKFAEAPYDTLKDQIANCEELQDKLNKMRKTIGSSLNESSSEISTPRSGKSLTINL